MDNVQKDKSKDISSSCVEPIDVYVPSQVDRKKAVLMYLLIGILVYLSKSSNLEDGDESQQFENDYIGFHIRQSVGIWLIIFVSLPILLLFSFIAFFRYLISFLLLIVEIICLAYFIKQSWDGKYDHKKSSNLMFFYKLGDWVLNIF